MTIVLLFLLCVALFERRFTPYAPVTLTSDRAGLVMESGAKVKFRGVQVGHVASITKDPSSVRLALEIDPSQLKYIPANIGAQIRATTAFGAKYVDLVAPDAPSTERLRKGAVLQSRNVTTEVNTVFENLVTLLQKIDPAKLNGVLTAFAEGFRGQGRSIGEAITDTSQVLAALNSRSDAIGQSWISTADFADTYTTAATDILSTLDAASTTSGTIVRQATDLDALLVGISGFSTEGIRLLDPNQANFVDAINLTEPTTSLLLKYNPTYTCMLVGAKWWLDNGGYAALGGDGRTQQLDATILLGVDQYRYPDNLPIVAAKGGPGGKPSCGSLPDASKNFPVRQLVTNTGWGTGLDLRPNPGIGHPFYENWLPVTRAVPEQPSVRLGGAPAPGPIPYPGAPPYGAPLYGPDGTPLYPGVPPPAGPPPALAEPGAP